MKLQKQIVHMKFFPSLKSPPKCIVKMVISYLRQQSSVFPNEEFVLTLINGETENTKGFSKSKTDHCFRDQPPGTFNL